MLSTPFLSILAAIATVVHAANHDVNVGVDGLQFTPPSISNAVKGDTITFRFSGLHSASESTLTSPCTHKSSGFDSGQLSSGTYKITLNSTDPVWVYCSVGAHCRAGMVFAVNPGSNLAAFQAAAQGQTVSSSTGTTSTSTISRPPTNTTSSSATISTSPHTSTSTTPRPSTASTITSLSTSTPGAASRSMSPSNALWVLAGAVLGAVGI
ncbi:SubName: Full=Uncharacterized protein {ECO:0000313/EMBL:CCA69776.1} [Serendipita indica DSM 11827]|uniref:Phytocyanin domain-containing protein n=1 Tax=Serendipita indica (strain DSM 11827) TaxID=1109443 RepID=G4TEM7_SERID|nr:SubName: Full=Uncharacterized protein {ECO:0000313/EMBL:CCA69776.1} [Serendipita indica DSM 11827]CCA69776.1 hypothetical protein PIIN_03716 [Serendipita indica DSM 11827]